MAPPPPPLQGKDIKLANLAELRPGRARQRVQARSSINFMQSYKKIKSQPCIKSLDQDQFWHFRIDERWETPAECLFSVSDITLVPDHREEGPREGLE